MGKVDKASYDATILDLPRLQGYARRVARETRLPTTAAITQRPGGNGNGAGEEIVSAHWVLHSTHHNIDKHESWGHEEYHEDSYWILTVEGTLLKYTKWFEEKTVEPYRDEGYSLTAMSATDIERLDFEDRYREVGRSDRGMHTYGNREAGRLMRHAKGVGLSLQLKKLLG